MRNPLQEQLIKAGLAKKSKVAQVVRDQNKQRHAKSPVAGSPDKVDTRQLQAERAERDRALSAQRNAQAKALETLAQVRQIVALNQVKGEGETAYAFEDAGAIRRITVDAAQRRLLAGGALVIARLDASHVLLPRAAADKVLARDGSTIVLDHGRSGDTTTTGQSDDADATAPGSDDDAFYARFAVPDDLVW